jgi:hypothetical protein
MLPSLLATEYIRCETKRSNDRFVDMSPAIRIVRRVVDEPFLTGAAARSGQAGAHWGCWAKVRFASV